MDSIIRKLEKEIITRIENLFSLSMVEFGRRDKKKIFCFYCGEKIKYDDINRHYETDEHKQNKIDMGKLYKKKFYLDDYLANQICKEIGKIQKLIYNYEIMTEDIKAPYKITTALISFNIVKTIYKFDIEERENLKNSV